MDNDKNCNFCVFYKFFAYYCDNRFALECADRFSKHDRDEVVSKFSQSNLKSPWVTLVLAIFFGALGIDRFYVNGLLNVVIGLIKLFGNILAAVIFMIAGFVITTENVAAFDMIFIIGLTIGIITDVIIVLDLFLAVPNAYSRNEEIIKGMY